MIGWQPDSDLDLECVPVAVDDYSQLIWRFFIYVVEWNAFWDAKCVKYAIMRCLRANYWGLCLDMPQTKILGGLGPTKSVPIHVTVIFCMCGKTSVLAFDIIWTRQCQSVIAGCPQQCLLQGAAKKVIPCRILQIFEQPLRIFWWNFAVIFSVHTDIKVPNIV